MEVGVVALPHCLDGAADRRAPEAELGQRMGAGDRRRAGLEVEAEARVEHRLQVRQELRQVAGVADVVGATLGPDAVLGWGVVNQRISG
jgi:hypothetical protein